MHAAKHLAEAENGSHNQESDLSTSRHSPASPVSARSPGTEMLLMVALKSQIAQNVILHDPCRHGLEALNGI